ncbi:MAG: ribbon-helix-helix domain-containing protein [Alphaproteobacteria bacterium]|nr:ribbon-helix-helix domain-containing protein [Alphaproteobacteria bacterium]
MTKLSVIIAGKHATSISLEKEFYDEFSYIAKQLKLSRNKLITVIDRERNGKNLSAAIRIFVMQYYKNLAVKQSTTPKRSAENNK